MPTHLDRRRMRRTTSPDGLAVFGEIQNGRQKGKEREGVSEGISLEHGSNKRTRTTGDEGVCLIDLLIHDGLWLGALPHGSGQAKVGTGSVGELIL